MNAKDFWDTLPHCSGYPACSSTSMSMPHSGKCKLFGKKEVTMWEFAELYANMFTARQLEELLDAEPNSIYGFRNWMRERAAALKGKGNEG